MVLLTEVEVDELRDDRDRLAKALRAYHDLAPRIAGYLNDVGAMLTYSDFHRANEQAEKALQETSG